MKTVVPEEILKKPVFSHLEKNKEKILAYQAYLALRALVLNADRSAIDSLLDDEESEATLTKERPELQPMGITILAALRKLIEQEKKEANLALSLKMQANSTHK
jgi:hypothetical protein